MHNNNCDGNHCSSNTGQVRLLPTGGDSNAILCYACFNHEIQYRKECNKNLASFAQFEFAQFELPKWDELKVYETA